MNGLKDKNTITSLELLEQLNFFREKEYEFKSKNNTLTKAESKKGKFTELLHYDFLKIIRDEFEEEINTGKISAVEYKDKKGENRPMFVITLNQAKQLLARESKFVRKAIIEYIENVFQENLNNEAIKIGTFENLSNYLQDSINIIQEFQKSNLEIRNKIIGYDLNNNEKYTNLLVFLSELNTSINKLINYLNSTFVEDKRYCEIRYQYDKFIQEKINFKMDN